MTVMMMMSVKVSRVKIRARLVVVKLCELVSKPNSLLLFNTYLCCVAVVVLLS